MKNNNDKAESILPQMCYALFIEIPHTAKIFNVIFTVFKCVIISTVISLYGLHLIASPRTVE